MLVNFPARPYARPLLLHHIDATATSSTPRVPPVSTALAAQGPKNSVKLGYGLALWWVGVETARLELLLSFFCSLSAPPGLTVRSDNST